MTINTIKYDNLLISKPQYNTADVIDIASINLDLSWNWQHATVSSIVNKIIKSVQQNVDWDTVYEEIFQKQN